MKTGGRSRARLRVCARACVTARRSACAEADSVCQRARETRAHILPACLTLEYANPKTARGKLPGAVCPGHFAETARSKLPGAVCPGHFAETARGKWPRARSEAGAQAD